MNKKGFTLVELLTVIAILAVIVAFAVPNVLKIFNKSVEEVMKIEEHNVVDASMLYISDNCGRNALSEEKREACNALIDNNRVGTNEVYFCLSTIQNEKYIDGISYRGSSPCDGLVVYKYDDDLGKFTDGRAFLQCGENEYLTKGYESYKEKIEGCIGETVTGQNPTPPPNPDPTPDPTPNPDPTPDPGPTLNQYTITYHNVEGATNNNPNNYTETIELSLLDASKSGTVFMGWYTDVSLTNKVTKISSTTTGNIDLYASWKNKWVYDYTEGIQTFIAPKTGKYKLEVWGAAGAYLSDNQHGGYGGYSVGSVDLIKDKQLYVVVGGQGKNEVGHGNGNSANCVYNGGYNGGGKGSAAHGSGGGGGATHIATTLIGSGLLSEYNSNRNDVLIVAGAGGGYNCNSGKARECDIAYGGSGGGYQGGIGKKGTDANAGNQTTGGQGQRNGIFGKGGDSACVYYAAPGGGAGYFGGAGGDNHCGGSGGSGNISNSLLHDINNSSPKHMIGYNVPTSNEASILTYSVDEISETAISDKAKKGNGYAIITYYE